MKPLYWQLAAIATIVLSYLLIKKPLATRWSIVIPIAWTAFTFKNLFHPPLIFIQLLFVWGTYILMEYLRSQKEQIAELKEMCREYSNPQTKEGINEAIETKVKRKAIEGKEHKKFLDSVTENAMKTICITSAGLTDFVINNDFESLIKNSLTKGTNIYLVFGKIGDNINRKKAIDRLEEITEWIKTEKIIGKLFYIEKQIHEKMLVKDDEYVVIGSNNWL